MKEIMNAAEINRALTRISHEIIENNKGTSGLIILGVKTRGVPLAERIVQKINDIESVTVPLGAINETLRMNVENKTVIVVDDVIYTGRTCRAALDAILDAGRAEKIQFVALVDRGHRELPLTPNYIGKNVPTSNEEVVHVRLQEIDGIDQVILTVR
jgi:pyrimidine operon attenuation protein/uracil phosphoribosyltransferase